MNRLFIDNSIGELHDKVSSGELTSEDLLNASIENIKELDPKYLAWETYRDKNWIAPKPGSPMDGPV